MADIIAEQIFGLLFENSPDAAFIVDRTEWKLMSANQRTADMFARTPDQLVGMTLQELACEPELDLTHPGHYEDVSFTRGDDAPIHVALQVSHLDTKEHGAVAAFVARDISRRRLLDNELETRNKAIALLAWRAVMGELVAGIAHHLNNPLGALSSTMRRLDRLSSKLPPELRTEHERLLERVNELARRIEAKVGVIVQASRPSTLEDLPELPRELEVMLARFAERIGDIPSKGNS